MKAMPKVVCAIGSGALIAVIWMVFGLVAWVLILAWSIYHPIQGPPFWVLPYEYRWLALAPIPVWLGVMCWAWRKEFWGFYRHCRGEVSAGDSP